jgi:hypothetical protein
MIQLKACLLFVALGCSALCPAWSEAQAPTGETQVQAKEQIIKAALYDLLQDAAEVERLFEVLVAQPEY